MAHEIFTPVRGGAIGRTDGLWYDLSLEARSGRGPLNGWSTWERSWFRRNCSMRGSRITEECWEQLPGD